MPKFILLPLALLVQEPGPTVLPGLSTDRPDFTEAPTTVPLGTFQVEMGSTWERTERVSSVNGAEMLVRWGLAERLEVRFGLPDVVRSAGESGVTDASLGLKLALGSAAEWKAAVLTAVAVPTGDARYGADGATGEVIVTFARDLDERWSFGTQISGSWGVEPREVTLGSTAVLGLSLGQELSAFGELAMDGWGGRSSALTLHHGYAYLIAPTLQLDFHVGVGLTDAAPDALVGLGLSTRFGG